VLRTCGPSDCVSPTLCTYLFHVSACARPARARNRKKNARLLSRSFFDWVFSLSNTHTRTAFGVAFALHHAWNPEASAVGAPCIRTHAHTHTPQLFSQRGRRRLHQRTRAPLSAPAPSLYLYNPRAHTHAHTHAHMHTPVRVGAQTHLDVCVCVCVSVCVSARLGRGGGALFSRNSHPTPSLPCCTFTQHSL
jgi:hypothetical protein